MNTNHINWAVFFWVQAASSNKISQKVNDFMGVMGWDEDIYPQDTLLRQWHKVARVYYENVRNALNCKDVLNNDLLENWINYTYKYWSRSCKNYDIENPKESYLDFLSVEGDVRIKISDLIDVKELCEIEA